MRKNKIKQMLTEKKPVVGGWLQLCSPMVAEHMAHVGYDYLVVDMEHSGLSISEARAMLQAIATTDTVPLVRTAWNDPAMIKCALDSGAYGVVIPMINTNEEAMKAVQACKYPTEGIRGMGGGRMLLYGGDDYFEHANEEILIIAMIEHIDAINKIDDIMSVPGVDVFYLGPRDLAGSMGLKPIVNNTDPKYLKALDHFLEAGKKHKVPMGIFADSPEAANQRIAEGFLFIGLGTDTIYLTRSARAALSKIVR